jgi:hypothetical protein
MNTLTATTSPRWSVTGPTGTRPPAPIWKPRVHRHRHVPAGPQRQGTVPKDRFTVDLDAGTVTCLAGQTAVIIPAGRGGGRASFRPWYPACQRRPACTAARRGRTITIHPHEAVLQRARTAQRDPAWPRYRGDRPIVERKVSTSPAGPGAAGGPVPAAWPASPPIW